MRLATGAQLGSYEILEPLGQGGMGEVYRARDTRLHREVALKIIHPDLSGPEHLGRFRREARVLASLCHPNIADIYELGEIDDTAFLVMELVPGDTLAGRLAAGPLPLADALKIAGQVAAALETVHEKGIVHRDLKPANIKVTADGVVKVLDFGLAKAAAEESAANASVATRTFGNTREGVVLGTAAYMSPEQARGWDVDRRTDVWALKCILFEMLTGRRTFVGDTQADTVAAVLEREPDWTRLPPSTPPAIVRLLRRCLQRDMKRRLRDIGDARFELEDAITEPTDVLRAGSAGKVARRISPILMIGCVAVGALIATLAILSTRPTMQPGARARFVVPLPPTAQIGNPDFPSVAIAPDGSRIAFVASRGGQTQLFLRPMDALEATPLAGTSNAASPFFSPDGRWLAFFANGQLKKVAISGGTPVTLCEAPVGLGGSWSHDDTILFAATTGSGLSRVSAYGGRPQRVTTLDVTKGEFSHRWPQWLPDGKTALYTVGTVGSWNDAQIVAQSMSDGQRSVVVEGGTNPHYLKSGFLLYARNGNVMSVPFDAGNLSAAGTAVPVIENILQSSDGAAQLSVSADGHVVYVGGAFESNLRRLLSVDRNGVATPLAAPPATYQSPRVSPDGTKLLVTTDAPTPDVWIYDIMSGSSTQLTFESGATFAVWTPDGDRVTFSSTKSGPPNLFTMPVSQPGSAERLAASEHLQIPGSWSPDGATVAFVERRPATGRDILLLSPRVDRAPRPFLVSAVDESAPRFSRDGRWLAYVSNESGRNEVFIRPVDDGGKSRQISIDGGAEPVWAANGREIVYRNNNRLMAVALEGRDLRAARPALLFEGDFARGTIDSANYDIMPDGQRFVMIQRQPQAPQTGLNVLMNWFGTGRRGPAVSH